MCIPSHIAQPDSADMPSFVVGVGMQFIQLRKRSGEVNPTLRRTHATVVGAVGMHQRLAPSGCGSIVCRLDFGAFTQTTTFT